jgi:hypothetical protein
MPSSLRSGSATGEAADYRRKCVGCTCTRQGRRSRERAVAVGQERAVAAQRISRIKKHRYDTMQNLESSVPPTSKLVCLSRGPDAVGGVHRIRLGRPSVSREKDGRVGLGFCRRHLAIGKSKQRTILGRGPCNVSTTDWC